MEAKVLPVETTEAIAMTEKKMDMSLDEIIKMSKKSSSKARRPPRQPVKNQGFKNGNMSQGNSKVQRFMDSRSSMRQGALAQRRSSFRGNHFPLTKEVAKKVAAMPIGNRVVNFNRTRYPATENDNPTYRTQILQKKAFDGGSSGKVQNKAFSKQKPQTLDALFASMKQQRMRTMSQQTFGGHQSAQKRGGHRKQWNLGGAGGAAHHSGNFGR